MSTIGQNIKGLRNMAGFSQDEFAEAIDVNRVTLSKYETDNSIPGGEIIIRMAKVLNVSADLILGLKPLPYTEADIELMEIRNAARRDADRKILLMLAKNGSTKDVRQVTALIGALKKTNPDFYEGDDPA